MNRLAILCMSHWRPELLRRMIYSACETADKPNDLKFYIVIDDDEKKKEDYLKIFADMYNDNINFTTFYFPRWSSVMSLNQMYDRAGKHEVYCFTADDAVYRTKGWDTGALKAYDELSNKMHIFAFQDNRDIDGTPFPMATRAFLDGMGYAACPVFYHWYADTWMKYLAQHLGCLTYLRDYKLDHDKDSDLGAGREKALDASRSAWLTRDHYAYEKMKPFLEFEKARMQKCYERNEKYFK